MDKLDSGIAYVMTKYSEHPKSCGMTPFGHFLFTMRLFALSFVSSMAFLVHAMFPWLLTETGEYLLELLHEHSCPLKSSEKVYDDKTKLVLMNEMSETDEDMNNDMNNDMNESNELKKNQ